MKDETLKDKRWRKEHCASQPKIILPMPAALSELPRDYPGMAGFSPRNDVMPTIEQIEAEFASDDN